MTATLDGAARRCLDSTVEQYVQAGQGTREEIETFLRTSGGEQNVRLFLSVEIISRLIPGVFGHEALPETWRDRWLDPEREHLSTDVTDAIDSLAQLIPENADRIVDVILEKVDAVMQVVEREVVKKYARFVADLLEERGIPTLSQPSGSPDLKALPPTVEQIVAVGYAAEGVITCTLNDTKLEGMAAIVNWFNRAGYRVGSIVPFSPHMYTPEAPSGSRTMLDAVHDFERYGRQGRPLVLASTDRSFEAFFIIAERVAL